MMHLRAPRQLFVFFLLLLLLAPAGLLAQATGATVKGMVADPDAAVIPGATVTLTPATGKPVIAQSGSDGTFTVNGVAPGTYSITVTMQGFASYVRQGVKIAAGQTMTINAKMAIQDQKTVIDVTTEANTLSVDQDSNASSTVISGKDLDALSDDPDELQNELSALAGPSAGPNGGQIYIDGFTGGQLPPKSSIREIRINQNPFSAQYDRPGFGRVEILTKPGTDKFHGQAQLQGNDKSFNTGSPLISASTPQPGYHTQLFNGNLSGPINKNASFTFGGAYRSIQDNTIIDPLALYAASTSANEPCAPGAVGCVVNTGFTQAVSQPQTRWDVSPRLDLGLGPKNTLTARYRYESDSRTTQGVGGNDLADNAYGSTQTENQVQISDNQTISQHVINETRFEWERDSNSQSPLNTTPQVSVQGAFTSGGASQQTASDIQNHIEVQNYTSIALAHNFIRLGGRLRTTSDQNTTTAGSNGSFTYTNICNYIGAAYGSCTAPAGGVPTPNIVSLTSYPTATINLRTTDLGLYAEDDWKVRPNLTFSYGMRFETQNYTNDKADFAPRLSFAWGVGKTKSTGSPIIVLRGGFGLFYDRFSISNQEAIVRNNGTNEKQFTLNTSTGATIPTTCSPTTVNAANFNTLCNPSNAVVAISLQTLQPNQHSPYIMQTNLGTDLQAFKAATVSFNYQNIRGVHQYVNTSTNFPGTGNTNPNYVYEYLSEGEFEQNQLIANINYRGSKHVTLFGFYVLNFAHGDTAGIGSFATQPFNLKADQGRSSFDIRNRVFLGGNISLPHLISISPLLVANSGSPFSVTTGVDQLGSSITNYRAALAPAGTAGARTLGTCGSFYDPATTTGPTTGYAESPVNLCTGPSAFTMNLRATKTFGFGGARNASTQRSGGGQGGPGGPQVVVGGGGNRGGGGDRGGGFGGGGGGANSGQKYNFTLGVQAFNVFNVVDRSTPNASLSSPATTFGRSQSLVGGIFSSSDAIRRIQLQAAFSF